MLILGPLIGSKLASTEPKRQLNTIWYGEKFLNRTLTTCALALATDASRALLIKGGTVGEKEAGPVRLVKRIPFAPENCTFCNKEVWAQ